MKKKPGISIAVTIVIVLLILLFAGLSVRMVLARGAGGGTPPAGGIQQGAAGGEGRPAQGSAQRTISAVRVHEVGLGTIENSVILNGDVLARNQVSIYPAVGGKLTEIRLGIGDMVSRGDVVAMVDPSRPGESYFLSPVISTVNGTILQVNYSAGDTVSTGAALYVVGDLSALVVETFVPERFANAARRGLSAQVMLEALPGEIFTAFVDELSPVLDPSSRTLKIRLRFTRGDSRIKAGMFATISLVINTRSGVPVVPRQALINTYGRWIVFITDEGNTARRREVRPGLENEESVEILEGIETGEKVVIAGQNFLSDGDPVRQVE
ncbi:MAG: efflux RND transporter periplasmic adaptor subunit [Treponema sp.]|jgi:multidrug efflux pump subunit AcrA (membrane-fusion protein)|nr:efflux RND transporter periplasmic adaptor subunit [Treponema sp.]